VQPVPAAEVEEAFAVEEFFRDWLVLQRFFLGELPVDPIPFGDQERLKFSVLDVVSGPQPEAAIGLDGELGSSAVPPTSTGPPPTMTRQILHGPLSTASSV
jgi:hypothetical protein